MAKRDAEGNILSGLLDSSRNLEKYAVQLSKDVKDSTSTMKTVVGGAVSTLKSIDKKLDKIIGLMGEVAGGGLTSSLQGDSILEIVKLNANLLKNVGSKFDKFIKDQYDKAAGKGKNAKEGAEAIKTISGSLKDLVEGLLLFSFVPGTKKFISFISGIAGVFEKVDPEKIEKGAKGVKAMGASILALGLTLAASTVLYIVGIPGALAASVIILGLTWIFSNIDGDRVAKGGIAVGVMAAGIALLGLGLYLFQKLGIDYETGFKAMLITGGLALVFGLAGKFAGNIALGALSLGLASIALMGISFGLNMFKKAQIEFKDVAILGGSLLAITGAFALAGLPPVSLFVAMGAIVLGLAALSLIGIAYGLKKFQALGFDEKQADQLKYGINSLSSAFGSIGIIESAKILLGSAAIATTGLAIASVSKALKLWTGVKFTEGDGKNLIAAVGSISAAFAQAGGSEGTSGSVLSFLTGIDLSPNNVERGITSVMKSGEAMKSVVEGVKAFASLSTIGLSEDAFDITVPGSLINNITSILNAIKAPFAEIGQSANGSGSLIKGIFGADFAESDVEQGIESVMDSGLAMKSVVDGITAFASLDKLGLAPDAFDSTVTGSLLWNVKSVLTAIKSVFAEIGQSANGGGSLISGIFGGDFSESDVEQGVQSVKGSGGVLKEISEGIKAFVSLEKLGLPANAFDATVPGTLLYNIKGVLTAVKSVFAEIGQSANGGGSLVKSIFGADFSESDVEQGIQSVKGVGSVIKDIADGVMVFAGKDFNADKAVQNITKIILSVPNILAKLQIKGDLKKDPKIIFLNTFVHNMERLAKIEKPLDKIAGSIDKMAGGLGKFGDFFKQFDPNMFKSFAEFTNALVGFSNVKTAELEKNTLASKPLIDNAAAFAKGNQNSFISNQTNNNKSTQAAPIATQSAKNNADAKVIEELTKQNTMLQETLVNMNDTMKAMAFSLTQIKTRLDSPLQVRESKI